MIIYISLFTGALIFTLFYLWLLADLNNTITITRSKIRELHAKKVLLYQDVMTPYSILIYFFYINLAIINIIFMFTLFMNIPNMVILIYVLSFMLLFLTFSHKVGRISEWINGLHRRF